MPPSRYGKPKLSKSDAEKEIADIVAGKECGYSLVPFKDYKRHHEGSTMKSEQYLPYYVLCHPGSRFHAGWFVCPYVLNGYCNAGKGILEIDTKKGGTNRFGKHMDTHTKAEGIQLTQRPLNERCRTAVADAAALAVVLDLRPLGFAACHEGIGKYAEAVFKAGQSVPFGANISTNSYIPSRTAVTNALSRLAEEKRRKFARMLQDSLNDFGGAVTIDGVNLKLQNRHFYDFTVHHIHICRGKTIHAAPTFDMKTTTILFVEGPRVGTAINIRSLLGTKLLEQYNTSLEDMQKNFTVVTDGAAVMACVAGSSVSRNIAPLDQTWMRCFVHVLHNSMKAAMESCTTDDILVKTAEDFNSMKKIVKHSKKNGWNSSLPVGFRLIQEVETRFGTHFLVAERFLKSATKVWDLIKAQNYAAAKTKFESIQSSTENGVSYPTIEAIVDAFRPVYDATVSFETSNVPMLHQVLPHLQDIIMELSRIERGGLVERDENQRITPSLYSMRLAGAMKIEIMKVEIHDMWLVACFLYPMIRDMPFWHDSVQREGFKARAAFLTRKMYTNTDVGIPAGTASIGASEGSNLNTTVEPSRNDSQNSRKRRFSFRDHVPRPDVIHENVDEVATYKSMSLRQLGVNSDELLDDPFGVVKFWYQKRNTFPKLYKIAMRVFATPASSCASERVFSILKKIVTPDRSLLTPEHLSEIIVSRSLLSYN